MSYVYILKCGKDNRYYIGQTNNIEERLKRLEEGRVKSTKSRRPLKLVHSELMETKSAAVKREKYLKSLKGGEEFKKILGTKNNT